jgi:hypothetical protein
MIHLGLLPAPAAQAGNLSSSISCQRDEQLLFYTLLSHGPVEIITLLMERRDGVIRVDS